MKNYGFELISEWLEVEYEEITEDMKEYTECEEDWCQPCFKFNNNTYWLSDFMRIHNNGWCNGSDFPEFIHGYESTSYHPLFIEISNCGDGVRVYKAITE